ncbi:MAG: hypothetical protein HZA29_05590 [Candidatus Omnitrophica bacterium]|nr:hypothetical protein [Candidatus Omnitrophota bacterium]
MGSFKYQLSRLAKFLKESRIDYAVLGGIAVSVYSEPRMTRDIDLNIVLKMENLSQFLKKAREHGFQPIASGIKKFAEDLLLHKLLSDRPRDREDARGIILRQGGKLDMEYVGTWLKKVDTHGHARGT